MSEPATARKIVISDAVWRRIRAVAFERGTTAAKLTDEALRDLLAKIERRAR